MSFNNQKTQVRSLLRLQHIDEAKQLLLALYEINAEDVEIWHLLATVNGMLGDFDDSAKWSRRVVEKYPHLADAWMNLAKALQHADNHEATIDAWQHVLQRQPANAHVQLELAGLYRRLGNTTAALQAYRKAIILKPGTAELHYNLGTFQQELGDHEQAEICYLKALELKPGLVQARNNLGLIYQAQCRMEEAMQSFNAAINANAVRGDPRSEANRQNATIAEVHRHRALLWLLQGNFDKGWAEYEWRHTDPAAVKREFLSPAWDGSSLQGKSILVSSEQGIGDEILFASCIPDLQRQAGQVILECNPRLALLFRRSFPDVRIRELRKTGTPLLAEDVAAADVHSPTGSLPRYLRRSFEDFPRQAYLHPDPDKVRAWQDRYRRAGEGIKVGISWRGGGIARTQRKRSTRLEQWLSVFALEGAQFINLQYGDCAVELQQLADNNGVTVHDWPDADPLQDLDDFAAQVAALDLVISVDNATVHMAGALGVPVWILQTFSPEWRWLLECEDSYWYPDVRQFRQPAIGVWDSVFESVRQALTSLKATKRMVPTNV